MRPRRAYAALWTGSVALLASILPGRVLAQEGGSVAEPGLAVVSAASFGFVQALQVVALLAVITLAAWKFRKTEVYARLVRSLSNDVLTNWRLVLLGFTGIVLSLASGWTTWDGMTNFTQSPILSFLITFGIQGVMLIAAWLIGETFAQSFTGRKAGPAGSILGALFTVLGLSVIGVLIFILWEQSQPTYVNELAETGQDWWSFGAAAIIATLVLAAIAYAATSREIISPYIRGTKVVLQNLPLWIMFLACMATSVFFSFDSLFSTIFPPDERRRAAELRVQERVAGILSNVGATLADRRGQQVERLMTSQAWSAFNSDLTRLTRVASEAPDELQKMKLERVEARGEAVQKERMAISRAEMENEALTAEKERLQREREGLDAESKPERETIARLEAELRAKSDEIVKAETAAEGEARGVRGTGQAGRGPQWRELMRTVENLKLDRNEIQRRLDAAQARLARINDRRAAIDSRLTAISTRQAELTSTQETAKRRMELKESGGLGDLASGIDAAGGLSALERERTVFRREPTKESFDKLQQLCASLLATVRSVPSLQAQASGINCAPEAAGETAARLFELNAALARFAGQCAAGERLAGQDGATGMLDFANACVQNSGLPGGDTAAFREELKRVALSRDDKAHRFVVTVNAFNDGNQLAYLALAIAIAIDGLVFMSGLFGANAVRSPLADSPIDSGRTAVQLESVVNNSLGPQGYYRYSTAKLVLAAMHPTTNVDGFMSEVNLAPYDAGEADRIRNVLNAGATLNLVERKPEDPDHYRLRSEFFEYLNLVCERELQTDTDLSENLRHDGQVSETERERELVTEEKLRRLVPHLEDATHPNSRASADAVLRLMQPYSADPQYSNRIELGPAIERFKKIALDTFKAEARQKGYYRADDKTEDVGKHIEAQCQRLLAMYEDTVRHVLNVGASEREVVEAPNEKDVFYIKPTFHRALVKLRKQGVVNDQPSLEYLIMQRADEAVQKLKRTAPDQMQIEHDRPRLIASSDLPRANGVAPGDREWALSQLLERVGFSRSEFDRKHVQLKDDEEELEGPRDVLKKLASRNGGGKVAAKISDLAERPRAKMRRAVEELIPRHSSSDERVLREVAHEIDDVIIASALPKIIEIAKEEIRRVKHLHDQLGGNRLHSAGGAADSRANSDDGTDVLRRLGSADEAQLNDDLLKIEAFEEKNFHIGEDFPAVVEAIERVRDMLQTQDQSRGAHA